MLHRQQRADAATHVHRDAQFLLADRQHRLQLRIATETVLPGVLLPRFSHAPDALIARWTIPQGAKVLDLGCGSGVLSLVALTRGAERLVALDVNPAVIATTALNIRDLGFTDRAEA